MRLGFYLPFATQPDVVASARALAAVAAMRQSLLEGVTDIIPSYLNIFFEFDAQVTTRVLVQQWANGFLQRQMPSLPTRVVEIPVQYNGIDLEWIASTTGLSVAEIIRLHSSQTYHTFAVGFTPGFPFLGVLPEALRLPRRATPRASVPAHSVAMAINQCGVYPFSSPGGWHLLGSAGVAMFDPQRDPAFWVQPGDVVRFVPRDEVRVPAPLEVLSLLPPEPRFPVLKVEEPGLLSQVMDAGRCLVGHLGLAQSGVLDARSAARANAVVGNAASLPVLELTLLGGAYTALQDVILGFAGFGMTPMVNDEKIVAASSFLLRQGQTLRFLSNQFGVRGYLSVAGGFATLPAWGSASTDTRAGLGRALKTNDVLGVEKVHRTRAGFTLSQPNLELMPTIRLLAGTQPHPDTLQALHHAKYTLERGDRMGLQFAGATLQGGDVSSEATPLGALQITSAGQPIILLHDRGRIGGYAKPAVVHPKDIWRLAQLRTGESIRFSVQLD